MGRWCWLLVAQGSSWEARGHGCAGFFSQSIIKSELGPAPYGLMALAGGAAEYNTASSSSQPLHLKIPSSSFFKHFLLDSPWCLKHQIRISLSSTTYVYDYCNGWASSFYFKNGGGDTFQATIVVFQSIEIKKNIKTLCFMWLVVLFFAPKVSERFHLNAQFQPMTRL